MGNDSQNFCIQEQYKKIYVNLCQNGETPDAQATFTDMLNQTGYQNFDFRILNPDLSIYQQFYLQGYSEAYFSHKYIKSYIINAQEDNAYIENEEQYLYPPQKMLDFASQNVKYLNKYIQNNYDDANWQTYWQTVNGTLNFLKGVTAGLQDQGYNYTFEFIYSINAISDYESLSEKWEYEAQNSNQSFKVAHKRPDHTHCTGLIYVPKSADDIFISQVTWTSWKSGFNKINKNIQMRINQEARLVQYSSYPGQLNSVDDFYQIKGNHLDNVVIETTYNLWNEDTYDYMSEQSILTFMRTQVANYLHVSQKDWVDIFMNQCSFTYNNNWVILDFEQWDSEKKNCKQSYSCLANKAKGIVYSLEPANNISASYQYDATNLLFTQRFFASLNSPTNKRIADFYGYDPDNVYYSYNLSRRLGTINATLGNESLDIVKTFDDFKVYMRQNNYGLDYSEESPQSGDPREGLSSRYDQCNKTLKNCKNWSDPSYKDTDQYNDASPFGATDSKSTSATLSKQFIYNYVYGPTHGDKQQIESPDLQVICDGIEGIAEQTEQFWQTDVFTDIPAIYCENRDTYCDQCNDQYEYDEEQGKCVKIDFTSIIIAYSVTLALIYIVLIAWLVVYFVWRGKSRQETITEN